MSVDDRHDQVVMVDRNDEGWYHVVPGYIDIFDIEFLIYKVKYFKNMYIPV